MHPEPRGAPIALWPAPGQAHAAGFWYQPGIGNPTVCALLHTLRDPRPLKKRVTHEEGAHWFICAGIHIPRLSRRANGRSPAVAPDHDARLGLDPAHYG